ncbi:hypothetical protein ALC53_08472 [Atta colombica]|uniref:Uncharacterized protein n=1 Tax=Atta colombica TaxID=520822 RepID=A0A195BAA9_9HYME|nr:hypothetical protein ALC53_08472 [Atta colombica]
MSNRSIENHVEFVLSTYLEREQGQSGAHIRRPYTGAEKDILNKNVMKTIYNQRIGIQYFVRTFQQRLQNNYCEATTMRTLNFGILILSQIAEFKFTLLLSLHIFDLKKRDSHICDMQALQPLPAPTNTANTAPAMTTSGGQPPLPVSETV